MCITDISERTKIIDSYRLNTIAVSKTPLLYSLELLSTPNRNHPKKFFKTNK